MKKFVRQCGYDVEVVYWWNGVRFPYTTERLIHIDLRGRTKALPVEHVKELRKCKQCNMSHQEWYKADLEDLKEVCPQSLVIATEQVMQYMEKEAFDCEKDLQSDDRMEARRIRSFKLCTLGDLIGHAIYI
jgi:hypothetical protein